MEKIVNTNLVFHINVVKSIEIHDERCTVLVDTTEYGDAKLIFDDVWDCRFTIENGIIDRGSKMIHCEETSSSIYEVQDSLYIDYFSNQVSGTRPITDLKDYILFDDVETVFEVLSIKEPYLEKG